MATGNMYFTCGSSVCKQKRMRAHLYTYAYTGSARVITCKYMWSNAAFDSTLATPRFGIIRTSYEQLWSRKRIHAQDLHVRQYLRALRLRSRKARSPDMAEMSNLLHMVFANYRQCHGSNKCQAKRTPPICRLDLPAKRRSISAPTWMFSRGRYLSGFRPCAN